MHAQFVNMNMVQRLSSLMHARFVNMNMVQRLSPLMHARFVNMNMVQRLSSKKVHEIEIHILVAMHADTSYC